MTETERRWREGIMIAIPLVLILLMAFWWYVLRPDPGETVLLPTLTPIPTQTAGTVIPSHTPVASHTAIPDPTAVPEPILTPRSPESTPTATQSPTETPTPPRSTRTPVQLGKGHVQAHTAPLLLVRHVQIPGEMGSSIPFSLPGR